MLAGLLRMLVGLLRLMQAEGMRLLAAGRWLPVGWQRMMLFGWRRRFAVQDLSSGLRCGRDRMPGTPERRHCRARPPPAASRMPPTCRFRGEAGPSRLDISNQSSVIDYSEFFWSVQYGIDEVRRHLGHRKECQQGDCGHGEQHEQRYPPAEAAWRMHRPGLRTALRLRLWLPCFLFRLRLRLLWLRLRLCFRPKLSRLRLRLRLRL